jgi:hypothetical protein
MFVIGSACTAVSLLYISLAANGDLESTAVTISAAFYICNFGFAAFGNTSQSICVRNFPAADRGKVRDIVITHLREAHIRTENALVLNVSAAAQNVITANNHSQPPALPSLS